jgi:hypothetical protein
MVDQIVQAKVHQVMLSQMIMESFLSSVFRAPADGRAALRKASLHAAKSSAVAVELIVVRIMNACAGKVVAGRTMAGTIAAHALLRDIGMVSTSGRKDETVRRLYDIREYIIALYKLDEEAVYLPAISKEDLRVCETCGLGGGATNKPLLEYVAQCK